MWVLSHGVLRWREPIIAFVGFFADLPAAEPTPRRRDHSWEPPEAEFPAIVQTATLLLARTAQVAVAVTGPSAFCTGMEIFLTARIRPSPDHPEQHPPAGRVTWPLPPAGPMEIVCEWLADRASFR